MNLQNKREVEKQGRLREVALPTHPLYRLSRQAENKNLGIFLAIMVIGQFPTQRTSIPVSMDVVLFFSHLVVCLRKNCKFHWLSPPTPALSYKPVTLEKQALFSLCVYPPSSTFFF